MGYQLSDSISPGQAYSPSYPPPYHDAPENGGFVNYTFSIRVNLAIRRGLTRGNIMVAVVMLSQFGCAVSTKPLTDVDRNDRISSDMQQLFADQEPVAQAITLPEAVARAIKYNTEHRVSMMEQAVATRSTSPRWNFYRRGLCPQGIPIAAISRVQLHSHC